MSPRAGDILIQEVAPRLRNAIPQIKTVGCEDSEELLQDGLALAAQMLHTLEERGKQVTPGNVCYYVTLHLKSGRRSYSAGRTDVMGSGTQLDGRSAVHSFEEPAGTCPETGEEIPLGEMLAGNADDPSMSGARNVDWESFLETHDARYEEMLCDLASGRTVLDVARQSKEKYGRVRQLKQKLADELHEFMGEDAIVDSMKVPAWRGNIMAEKERFACRSDRRH